MITLLIREVVRNAAVVFSGVYGAVTRQARQAGCSRQTVYYGTEMRSALKVPSEDLSGCEGGPQGGRRVMESAGRVRPLKGP